MSRSGRKAAPRARRLGSPVRVSIVLACLCLFAGPFPAEAADPVQAGDYNPFVGQAPVPPLPPADPRPVPPPLLAVPPIPQPYPGAARDPSQLRHPPPRDLTIVVAHGRMAILRTQNGRYAVKDGEVLTFEGVRYRPEIRNATIRLIEVETNLVAFEGYVGTGLSPEQRSQSRRSSGVVPSLAPMQQPSPQPQRSPSFPPATLLPPLPATTTQRP